MAFLGYFLINVTCSKPILFWIFCKAFWSLVSFSLEAKVSRLTEVIKASKEYQLLRSKSQWVVKSVTMFFRKLHSPQKTLHVPCEPSDWTLGNRLTPTRVFLFCYQIFACFLTVLCGAILKYTSKDIWPNHLQCSSPYLGQPRHFLLTSF